MGLFDALLGRTKPVRANLDALFALPSAAVTLQTAAGLVSLGSAGVCWKPPAGQPAENLEKEIGELLDLRTVGEGFGDALDSFDYGWLLLDDPDIEELVTKIHMANSTLQDNGWGPQLLCSVFGFVPGPDAPGTPSPSGSSTCSSAARSTRSPRWTRRRSGATPSSSCASAPWWGSTCRWKPTWRAGSPCGTCRSLLKTARAVGPA